jgi:hypothetical protein
VCRRDLAHEHLAERHASGSDHSDFLASHNENSLALVQKPCSEGIIIEKNRENRNHCPIPVINPAI